MNFYNLLKNFTFIIVSVGKILSISYYVLWLSLFSKTESLTICQGFKDLTCPERWQKVNDRFQKDYGLITRTTPVFYKSSTKHCEFRGWNVVNLTKSTRQRASLPVRIQEGMRQVLFQTKSLSTELPSLNRMGLNMDDLADKFFKASRSTAPELGTALGIFGSIVGKPITKNSPSTIDIMDSLKAAVDAITERVTKVIDISKGYVGNRFLEHEKNESNSRYRNAFGKMRACLKMTNIAESDECQEKAYEYIFVQKPQYFIWPRHVMTGITLDDNSIKELETSLVPARNFANLVFLMLKPLIEVYRSKGTMPGALKLQKLFEIEMVAQVDFFTEYFLKAAAALLKYHEIRGSACGRYEDVHCLPVMLAGSIHIHECSCIIDKGFRQSCVAEIILDANDRDPGDLIKNGWDMSYTAMYMDDGREEDVAKHIAFDVLEIKDRAYKDSLWGMLKQYLEEQILSFIPVWIEYKKWALSDQGNDDDDDSKKKKRKVRRYK